MEIHRGMKNWNEILERDESCQLHPNYHQPFVSMVRIEVVNGLKCNVDPSYPNPIKKTYSECPWVQSIIVGLKLLGLLSLLGNT